MNDIFQPFAIDTGNGPLQEPVEEKTTRKARGPRRKAAKTGNGRRKKASRGEPAAVAEASEPTTRKARAPRKTREIKIGLSAAMGALTGLTPEDAKFLAGVVQAMQPFNKKSRQRIVGALGKVFT